MREYANDHRPLPDAWLGARKPYCRRAEKDCSARSKSGRCNALCNAKFGSKPCPFYKTWDQQKVEHQVTYERLIVLERYDLLETYRPDEYLRNKKKKNEKPSDLMTSQGY